MEIFGKLGIDVAKLFFQIINFGIVLYFLNRWVYKPLLGILAKRREEMAQTVAKAEQAQKESEQTKERLEAELAAAREKAGDIVSRAEKQASETRKNAQDEATVQAEEIITQGKKAVEAEKESLMGGVQKEIASLVVAASGKVMGKEVEGRHDAFIEGELKK